MRSFLLTSVICMLAAGIYGTIDLTFDLKNGTFIQYEDEGESVYVSQFAYDSKGIFKKTNVKVPHKEEKKKAVPTLINKFSDIEFEDFSRGEPIDMSYMMELSTPDSLVNAEVTAAINDTLSAIKEKTKNDSAATAKEERKFSMKLYSRGRPPKKVIKEEVAVENNEENKQ